MFGFIKDEFNPKDHNVYQKRIQNFQLEQNHWEIAPVRSMFFLQKFRWIFKKSFFDIINYKK